MKKIVLVILVASIFSCATNKEDSLPENTVARVYGEYIYSDSFNEKVEKYKNVFASTQNKEPNDEELASIKENLLTSLIDRIMYLRKFDELGLSIEQGMVDAQLNQIIGTFQDKEAYLKELEQNGFTEKDFQEEITYQFKMKQLGDYIKNQELEITEEDINKYYTENRSDFYDKNRIKATASHILIKTDEISDEEALKQINEIKERIDNGMEFSEAASQYSQCPSSNNGGSLGEFGQGAMVKEFDQKVFTMELNTVSDPVKTQFGYHLILTTDRVNSAYLPIDDVKDYLILKIKEERFINQCKEEAQILRLSW